MSGSERRWRLIVRRVMEGALPSAHTSFPRPAIGSKLDLCRASCYMWACSVSPPPSSRHSRSCRCPGHRCDVKVVAEPQIGAGPGTPKSISPPNQSYIFLFFLFFNSTHQMQRRILHRNNAPVPSQPRGPSDFGSDLSDDARSAGSRASSCGSVDSIFVEQFSRPGEASDPSTRGSRSSASDVEEQHVSHLHYSMQFSC